MSRWLCVLCLCLYGICQGQPFTGLCQSADDPADPEYQKTRDWLEDIYTRAEENPVASISLFLSEEALSNDIDKYPCLALVYQYELAKVLWSMEAFQEAEKAAHIALRLDSLQGMTFAQNILSTLAGIAYQSQDFDAAVKYYRLNLNITRASKDARAVAGAHNNLGLSYFQMDSIEIADSLFAQGYKILESGGEVMSPIASAILDNLADIALIRTDTALAFTLLHRKDSILAAITPDSLRILDTWMSLANLYQRQGDYSTSGQFLAKATSFAAHFRDFKIPNAYRLESLWLDQYIATNDNKKMLQSVQRLTDLHARYDAEMVRQKNEISRALREYADFNARQVRDLANVQMEKHRQEQVFRSRTLFLLLSVIALGVICLLGYLYYRQIISAQRIKSLKLSVSLNDERLRREQLEKELLQKNLEAKSHDLTSYAMDNMRRREWSADVMEQLNAVLTEPKDKRTDAIKKLYYQLMHQNQIQERLTIAQENHETINKIFIDKLRGAYPDLTDTEIDLCILIRLGLSGKEIAVVRNVDPESIRKAKYRLRKRLEISTPEELKDYLSAL